MTVQKRISFTPDAEQSVMTRNGVDRKGSGVGHTTYIGLRPASISPDNADQLFRDLLRYPIEWPADMYRVVDGWIDFTPDTTLTFGGTPRIDIERLLGSPGQQSFEVVGGEALGNVYTDNDPQDSANWAASQFVGTNVAIPAFANPNAKPTRARIPAIIEDLAPARVKRRDNTPCGGLENFGVVVHAHNETTGANRWGYRTSHNTSPSVWPTLTIVYDASIPPGVPIIISPVPSSDGTTVDSPDAKRLTVEFVANLAAGDTAQRVQVEVYADGAEADEDAETQPVTGTRIATSTVAPTPTGQANRFKTSLTGLRPREYQLRRTRVQNQDGTWGRWTELAQGRIFSAYTPGVPIDPRMTSDPTGPVISATLNSQDPEDGVTGLTGTFVRHNPDGTTTNLWPDLSKVEIAYVAGVKRAEVTWRGIGLNDGDKVSWRVALYNRDGVLSPLTPEQTTTMRTLVGPTFDPPDATTKLTSRTTGVTIKDPVEFDGFRYRLYRNDILFYTSPIIASGPDVTAGITFPAGLLNWGDTFGIEGETRPTNTSTFGPTSTRAVLYINTLPTTSLEPRTLDGFTGPVLPDTDVIWRAPYSDPDAARYGETPVAKLLEIRQAATPQGSGVLVESRLGIAALMPIPEDEHSGFEILPLTDAADWAPEANVSAGTVASAPAGYTGDSLRLTFASSASSRGAVRTFTDPIDLSGFSSHSWLPIWRRISSVTNLDRVTVGITDADGEEMEWIIAYGATTLDTWEPEYPFLGFPDWASGDFDWSRVTEVWVWVYPSGGSFAGTVDLRALHIGVDAINPPDGSDGIVFEQSYDARVRYRDDADVLVTTQLAASVSGGATNVKVDDVTDLTVGGELTIGDDDDRLQETRTIVAVGTSGPGGTGVTLADELFLPHADDDPVRVLPWGPNTAWRRVKVSEPPVVVATSPTDGATVTDPTTAYEFTFTSPAGKAMVMHVLRVYDRIDGVDNLLYERDVAGAATVITGPFFLLEDGKDYAWEVDAYDSDGLVGTSDRLTFTTDFTVPDAITDLAATVDTARGWVTLTWTPSVDANLAFHVVRWRDADGQFRRIDLGPRLIDDGRDPLLAGTFTFRGGRLGSNVFQVSVHNGSQESDPDEVEVTLQPARPGAWMLKVDDERGLSWPFDPESAVRTPRGTVDIFAPPGRPFPVHHFWGTGGDHVSIKLRYLPSEVRLASALKALFHAGTAVYIAAPSGYDWDVIRGRIVAGPPNDPQQYGLVDLSIELDEIAPEVPA